MLAASIESTYSSATLRVMDMFGARLAAARKAAKLSQEALAREVGVALMTISRYERDAMGIDDEVLDRSVEIDLLE